MRNSYLVTRFRLARWRTHASQLWSRYRAVACLDDQHAVYQRLSAFLESFRAFYAELATADEGGGEEGASLDHLYGDCTEILYELIDYVERCVCCTLDPQRTSSTGENIECRYLTCGGRPSPSC